jgi:hypothetical protein
MEYVLYGVIAWIAVAWAIKGVAILVFKKFPSLRPDPDESRKRLAAQREAKALKKTAATTSKKKKRGPIGGSHTAEIMMFGEDPVTRRAARKVRDKFF